MIPPQLTERARAMIIAQIKANISVQLADIRADRNDPRVNTDPPISYFIFDGAHTYQCPAIFVVADSGEIPEENTGANFVDILEKFFVSAVVEGQDEGGLTIKAERYQAALFQCLHWQTLVDTTENVKLWVRITRFKFSPLYTKTRAADNMGNFRKEVELELEVKHMENPNT